MSQDKPPSTNGRRSLKDRLLDRFSTAPHDQESLIELVRAAEANNVLEPDALAMIEGALQVSDMRVRDIMVPKVQMNVVENDAEPAEILKSVIESGHSRFPVVSSNKDEVIGILLAKDLLQYFASDEENKTFDIKDVMRPAVFVPESKRLNILLREFRASRNHMAIIVDEYCSVGGLVTIEDVIEEIVGEIEDEHDIEDEEPIQQHTRNRYTVKALTPIDDFNDYFNTSFDDNEYETVGGMVLNAFGHVPKRGEMLELDGFNIKIMRSDKRRVHLMRFTKLENNSPVAEDTT